MKILSRSQLLLALVSFFVSEAAYIFIYRERSLLRVTLLTTLN
ncbi:hypothetical protein [Sphaerospermopsis aphanizomenoides]|nr:hypothetical protein [Sphaerospermopsis aphanizomenoides]